MDPGPPAITTASLGRLKMSSSNWTLAAFAAGGATAALSLYLFHKLKGRKAWNVGENQPIPYAGGWKSYSPEELKASGGAYGLVISTVVPRPIALVSSQDANGTLNCAPYSYFNAVSHDPPLVVIGMCINGRTGQKKDSLVNIEQTGEFVVNIISSWYLESANHCCGSFPPEEDEMQISGLTNVPSEVVRPPRVGEAAVQLECKIEDIKPVYNDAGEHTVSIVTGRIVRWHVHKEVLTELSAESMKPVVDWRKLQPIGRLGGDTYTFVKSGLDLPRPDRKV